MDATRKRHADKGFVYVGGGQALSAGRMNVIILA
jgi:hypothetical protein